MKVFFKSMRTFRGMGTADVLSHNLCLDSTDGQASSVVTVGEYARTMTGNWLVIDGLLYVIDKTTPQDGRTQFTLLEPFEAFSRPLLYEPFNGTAEKFLANTIKAEFIEQQDPEYSMPYLSVSELDTIAFIEPAINNDGIFKLPELIRTLRQLSALRLQWSIGVDSLSLEFLKGSTTSRNILFNNGHNQLSTAAYSKSGLAKITVLQPVDSGETDADGAPVMITQKKDFYLSETGEVSETVPARRAEGGWDMITVAANQDAYEKVRQAFAKNKASHKIEFFSDREMHVFDPCTIKLYGEVLTSIVSYKGKMSTDGRYFYKSGELATRASEKLRSVVSR